jgi:predicted tellurium resistance membrane protein TerC
MLMVTCAIFSWQAVLWFVNGLKRAIFRIKVICILGSLILAVLGAYLVVMAFAAFPQYSYSYEGAISFFIFWIAGIVITFRSKAAPDTYSPKEPS